MARKRNADDRDESAQRGQEGAEEAPEPITPFPEGMDSADSESEAEDPLAAQEAQAPLPTEADLRLQGFTADEVNRLVHISDRVARSQETRDAEAEIRRLRFTRWLIEHGVLDEWSA